MAAIPPPPPDRPLAGIALCVSGLFLFNLQDIVIKSFSDTYSVVQIVFTRGVVALIPILGIALLTGGRRGLRTAQPRLLLLRGGCGFLAYITYYMAIAALPLVEVVILTFSAPIMVTVLSALILKEPVGARRWSALAVGFFAIVLVVGPSGDFKHLGALLALLGAFCYACSLLLTRVIGGDELPWTITLYSSLAFVIGSAIAALGVAVFGAFVVTDSPALLFLLRPWVVPPLADCLLMGLLGVNFALAFHCQIKAYRTAAASVVAPFEYTYILWAVVFGYLIWGEAPRATSIAGVALLIACGLYILRRELQDTPPRDDPFTAVNSGLLQAPGFQSDAGDADYLDTAAAEDTAPAPVIREKAHAAGV